MDAVGEHAFGGDDNTWFEPTIGSDADFATNENLSLKMSALADYCTGLDDAERSDCSGGGDLRVGSDNGGGMNAGRRFGPEHLFESGAEPRKPGRGFFQEQEKLVGFGFTVVIVGQQDDRCSRAGNFGFIFCGA